MTLQFLKYFWKNLSLLFIIIPCLPYELYVSERKIIKTKLLIQIKTERFFINYVTKKAQGTFVIQSILTFQTTFDLTFDFNRMFLIYMLC